MKIEMPTDEQPVVVHLHTSGDHACRSCGHDSMATEDPAEVTCKTCLKTRAYGFYLSGWRNAKSEARRRIVKVLVPLIKLSSEA